MHDYLHVVEKLGIVDVLRPCGGRIGRLQTVGAVRGCGRVPVQVYRAPIEQASVGRAPAVRPPAIGQRLTEIC
jgi:hypothetical protein